LNEAASAAKEALIMVQIRDANCALPFLEGAAAACYACM
jgi:hypothetical protein